jgi:WD40 repeat protein
MLVASETGGRIFVWDVKRNIPERLTGTKGNAYQVAFSRNGGTIAAGSDDGVIRTWQTQELTNDPIELRGHRGPVSWVGFSPDGSLASACPTDKTIRIWNQHSPLGEVTVLSSGKLKSWPFFGDMTARISFVRDHIPFNGEGRLTLSAEDRCKIAPSDDGACKPKLELIQ